MCLLTGHSFSTKIIEKPTSIFKTFIMKDFSADTQACRRRRSKIFLIIHVLQAANMIVSIKQTNT